MMTTNNEMLKQLSNSDKFNIISAFQTDNPDRYFQLFFAAPEGTDKLNYIFAHANLDKYIQQYIILTNDNKIRGSFWHTFKREDVTTISGKGQTVVTNMF